MAALIVTRVAFSGDSNSKSNSKKIGKLYNSTKKIDIL